MGVDSRAARAMFFALVLASVGGAGAGELDKIKASRQIVIAHRDASVPLSYLDKGSVPLGYSIDLCLKVVDALRRELKLPTLEVKWLPVTSASRIPVIAEGKASMECGSTTNTAERRQQVSYSIAHFISSSRFLVKTASGVEKIQDLAGKKVVSTKGTTNLKVLQRLNDEQSLKMLLQDANDHAEAFAMVESGKVDAFAMDDVLLYGLRASSANGKNLDVVGKPMSVEPYAVMLPKGDAEFKRVVDQEVRRVIVSGEINAMYKKWFNSPIPPRGINLDLPMSFMLKESFKYPSDKVGDLL